MRLYGQLLSDTGTAIRTRGGSREIQAVLYYGTSGDTRRALLAAVEYDPDTNEYWLIVEGPRHGKIINGKKIIDYSRQQLEWEED